MCESGYCAASTQDRVLMIRGADLMNDRYLWKCRDSFDLSVLSSRYKFEVEHFKKRVV